jgi:hypothetical protein
MASVNDKGEHLPPGPAPQSTERIYQPLDPNQFQIRILVLSAGAFNDPLSGSLETVAFDESPHYDALSYVWGVGTAPAPLLIGLSSLPISQNLDAALRHLRLRDSEQRLWVDAICINQPDLREKADQVKNMGVIYSRAARAIVWLGDADTQFEPVKKFLRDLDLQREYLKSFASEAREPIPRHSRLGHTDPEFSLALRVQKRPTKVLEGLLDLLSRPYWERVWIIQEISKASIVQIRFGTFESPLNPLLLASRNLKTLSERSKTLLRAIIKFRAQEQGYGNMSVRTQMSLVDAMITTRYSLASISRDKIYALLGLTSDGASLVPLITYVATEEKIFDDLTSAIIRSQQPSNVLLLTKWVPLRERLGKAANWSIDWADLGYHLPPWLCKLPRSKPASVLTRADFNGLRLATKGLHIATLTQVQGAGRRAAAPASPAPPGTAWRNQPVVNASEPPAAGILKQLNSDLLNKFAPGFRSTTLLSTTQLIDALARMIRDVHKGEASADYDLRGVDDVLEHLGSLSWQKNPLWEWARQYNSSRASEAFGDILSDEAENFSRSTSAVPSSASGYSSPPLPAREKKLSSRIFHRKGKSSGDQRRSQLSLTPSSPLQVPRSEAQTPVSPGPRVPPLAAYHFWEDVLSTLDTVPEYKLRFALAEHRSGDENLVLVCDDARIGDDIYHIEHSILPVVLRDYGEYFELIGEVCLGRQDTGEWDMPVDDIFAPGSRLQNGSTLYIRLGDNGGRRKPSYSSLYND